jgi:anti-sigma factor RsiW
MNARLSDHLSEVELVNYVHRALGDVERETMDRHLAECASCRGQLDRHEALQRQIRSDLRSVLQKVRPSRRMQFSAPASVRERVRAAGMSRWFGQLLSNAAVLSIVLLQMALLAVLLKGVGSQPGRTAVLGQPGSTGLGIAAQSRQQELPRGWTVSGGQPEAYEVGVDRAMAHGGRASGYVRSISPEPIGSGTLGQTFRAEAYRGQRVRLSGYVRAGLGSGWTGLWMRVDGQRGEQLALSDMRDRPITNTVGWERHEVVLDVPQESASITIGVSLEGTGWVWVDDFRFEVVGLDVPTTD